VHRHLHGVAYLITRQPDMALMLYSLPLLPGVALHELSHALMAALLGVKTANLTLIPQRQPEDTCDWDRCKSSASMRCGPA